MSMRVEVEMAGTASRQPAASGARLTGDAADRMIEGLRAYQRAGVRHIVLALRSGAITGITTLMADIGQRVVPRLRD